LLQLVEMEEFSKIKAQYLSGGQMQRVAIAMVLAHEPEILLLDEPFSHIDNFRRGSLSRKLFAYLSQKQIACIVATHDSADVFSFANQVVIIRDGKVVDAGNPKTVHDNPKNKYTASLFGDVNEIPARYFKPDSEGSLLVYPYQLYVVQNSRLMVTVKRSYYRGNYYLIESIYENGVIFFENETDLSKERITFLQTKSKP
jgi:ABC-type sulfate/molybdate transport systems ATPase subunit